MNQAGPQARKAPAPAPAPPRAAAQPAGRKDRAELAAQRVLVRLTFVAPVFGKGEHTWSFLCDGVMAEELQQALIERRSTKLEFPTNTVVVDTTQVALADFQPQP